MEYSDIIERLEQIGDPSAAEGMAKFGITANKIYGVSIPNLRMLAKEIGKDHSLAQELWNMNSRETRILASMVDNPKFLSEKQMDSWVRDFDSWEVCDQCIMNLFEKVPVAWDKAVEWSADDSEFVKRAGFVMMARLAVSDKVAGDARFMPFFPIIRSEAVDSRNFVKKAVNWALRQIGKRNPNLNSIACSEARAIMEMDDKSARWIATDALRELESEAVRARLGIT
ncbi:DNA alkylation repair protein [Candidatus Latescibacterota bacterium]